VVQSRYGEHDREQTQEREVAARHQPEVEEDRDEPADRGDGREGEIGEWNGDLSEMIESNPEPMDRLWKPVEVPGERIGHRLCFVVVIEAGPVPPAGIAPEFDETCPEHGPKEHPPHEKDRDQTWRHLLIAQKDRQ